jgi:hypothetical protein
LADNYNMSTIEDELTAAVERAAQGMDRTEARKAADEVDRIRERNRRLYGQEEIGVSIIREFRGPLPE